jgi:hypothetical protein
VFASLLGFLLQSLRSAVAGWNRFWFRPADPATLGLIRIFAGGMLLYTHLIWSLDLDAFFGPQGWLSPRAVELIQRGSYSWSYFWWLPTPAWRWAAHGAALLVFAMFTLGLFTRVTSILALIATLSYIGRAPGALFGLDQINSMLALYLAIGPSGADFSLDRLLAERRARRLGKPAPDVQPLVGANIAIRLMQLHLCVIYAFAGTSKLMGPAWWDGSAMWQALANLEYQSVDMTWMAHWPRLVAFMTHLTILWEVYYVALIWPRQTRYVMLAMAVPLHLGIGVFLGMMTFGTIMLTANLSFVPPEMIRAALRWRPGQGRGADDAPATIRLPSPAPPDERRPRMRKR